MSLTGKVALVTGGGRGLGQETCRELARAGAEVILADVDQELAGASAAQIRSDGTDMRVTAVRCDVRDETQIAHVLKGVAERYGRLHILVNNAGVNVTASTETLSLEEWDRILATNLRGPFVLSKLALPLLKNAGSGDIVNVISSFAKRVRENCPAYVASKWGLLGYSQLLYLEARKYNIRVTAFSPAAMRTRLLLDRFPDMDQARLQEPAEVAKIIRFLLELPAGVTVPDIYVVSPNNEDAWP